MFDRLSIAGKVIIYNIKNIKIYCYHIRVPCDSVTVQTASAGAR